MARTRIGQHRIRPSVERRDERVEVARVDDVVRREIGDQICAGLLDPRIEGGTDAAVRLEAKERAASAAERLGGDRRSPVAGAVVDDDQLPVLEELPEQAGERAVDEGSRVVRRHDDGHPGTG